MPSHEGIFWNMEQITSTSNAEIKAVRNLQDKKYRKAAGLYIAEGYNLVKDIPQSVSVQALYYSPDFQEEGERLAAKFGCKGRLVDQKVMKSITETVSAQGIVAVIRMPEHGEEDFGLGDALFLDGVSDSGNLGTVIRTAAATGFKEIYLINCADCYSGKAVRASMGGIFRVKVIKTDAENARKQLKKYNSVALDMGGTDLFALPEIRGRAALILGSEAHGVSKEMLDAAEICAALPMEGGMESLNAAVAAGIAMYDIQRKRRTI